MMRRYRANYDVTVMLYDNINLNSFGLFIFIDMAKMY